MSIVVIIIDAPVSYLRRVLLRFAVPSDDRRGSGAGGWEHVAAIVVVVVIVVVVGGGGGFESIFFYRQGLELERIIIVRILVLVHGRRRCCTGGLELMKRR